MKRLFTISTFFLTVAIFSCSPSPKIKSQLFVLCDLTIDSSAFKVLVDNSMQIIDDLLIGSSITFEEITQDSHEEQLLQYSIPFIDKPSERKNLSKNKEDIKRQLREKLKERYNEYQTNFEEANSCLIKRIDDAIRKLEPIVGNDSIITKKIIVFSNLIIQCSDSPLNEKSNVFLENKNMKTHIKNAKNYRPSKTGEDIAIYIRVISDDERGKHNIKSSDLNDLWRIILKKYNFHYQHIEASLPNNYYKPIEIK